jgi:hypothetical protein
MSTVSRVDQAILLLKDRLRRLDERAAGAAARASRTGNSAKTDALVPLRQLAQRGGIAERELRRALVRTLLADALGDELVSSLEFQSIADDVARMIEGTETGRTLIQRALAELR